MQFKWTVFPLHPETPEEGVELSQLFAGRGYDIPAMQQRLRDVADQLGLPLEPRTRTFNSRKAQELGKLAERLGLADRYHQAVYRAYFVGGRNIGDLDEIVKIAEGAGLDREEALKALGEQTYAKQVDDDWRRARLLGITGVPAFLCDNRLLVGFRPYEDLEALLAR